MGFEKAMEWMEETYHQKRSGDLKEGRRLRWSTDDFSTMAEMIDTLDSTDEDQKWFEKWSKPKTNINELIGLGAKLGWLCGIRHDVRMQFCAGKDDRLRGALDNWRYEILRAKWAEHGLRRLREIIENERSEEA